MSKNYNSTLQTNNSFLEKVITQLNGMLNAGGNTVTWFIRLEKDLIF